MLPCGSQHPLPRCEPTRSALTDQTSCAIAVIKLLTPILERNGLPGAALSLVCGDVDVGKSIVGSKDVDLCELSGDWE